MTTILLFETEDIHYKDINDMIMGTTKKNT
ncbi:MAG: hypothetical protein CM15mV25_1450 [uncultured marine virus]|nr:MAG: hypothetical protein CM15mV25_1450 [uncultured marine virus]